jgi:hypothetical protein
MSKTHKLIERMTGYDTSATPFDGYPNAMGYDEGLISDALEENESNDALVFLCYLASQYATTPTHYQNAKDYVSAYFDSVWDCNMIEGGNSAHPR